MKTTDYHKPSIKTLCEGLRIDKPSAIKARTVMAGEIRITGNPDFPKTNAWMDSCFHKPRRIELIMSALDELLEFHGVEPLWSDRDDMRPVADYLNGGDTYTPTILFLHDTQSFRVTSWGDFVETNSVRLAIR